MNIKSFYSPHLLDFEEFRGESDTIPDLSLTVRELLQRYAVSGQVLPSPESGDNEDFDSPDGHFDDLVDAMDAVNSGQSIMDTLNVTNSNVSDTSDVTNSNVTNSNVTNSNVSDTSDVTNSNV